MANERPKATKIPVITTRHAQGIRRQHARDSDDALHAFLSKNQRSGYANVLGWFRNNGRIAAQRRRPPTENVPAGFDVVEIILVKGSGEVVLNLQSCDKRGAPMMHLPARFLLHISKHATEALFQRLHTQDVDTVRAELRLVGAWLLENLAVVGMETKGYLLSPSGVFPFVAGEPFQTENTDGRYHWVATTWIADTGLADNADGKRRVAEAVREARSRGMQVGFIHPGVGTV